MSGKARGDESFFVRPYCNYRPTWFFLKAKGRQFSSYRISSPLHWQYATNSPWICRDTLGRVPCCCVSACLAFMQKFLSVFNITIIQLCSRQELSMFTQNITYLNLGLTFLLHEAFSFLMWHVFLKQKRHKRVWPKINRQRVYFTKWSHCLLLLLPTWLCKSYMDLLYDLVLWISMSISHN